MTAKTVLVYLGKLILSGAVFAVGTVLGGILATALQLRAPSPPSGADMTAVGLYTMLTTPLLALALAVLAGRLSGGYLTRALSLAFFTWITYTLNTQLEASIFSTYAAGFWFAAVDFAVPALLCGAAVALLFPPHRQGEGFFAAAKSFFAGRAPLDWVWRLVLAAVAFMPVYFLFGMMAAPFVSDYYRQNLFGLALPTIDQILPILFVRSVLFLLACLPILILWQGSARSLFWRLGFALYLLVGLIYMLVSTWLPLYVRFPHSLEILADEFVYAGLLVLLLVKRGAPEPETRSALARQGLGLRN